MAATKTKKLEALRQDEVKERQRAREHELEASAAKRKAEESRAALVEAHAAAADPRAVKSAEKAKAEASDRAESAAIEAEGAEMRAERAGQKRTRYEAEHARDLIAELEPAATEVATRLERTARELIVADQEWSALSQRVSELVVAVPNASPIQDAPSSHVLAGIVRDVRRTLNESDVVSPAPHFHGLSRREAA